jgi:acetylornithine/N-succinyldiaminopimelate aminotransferase
MPCCSSSSPSRESGPWSLREGSGLSPTTQELAEKYLMQTGRRLPVTFVRGQGCLVYDDEGREYLDLVAGIAVNLLGHAHPDVAAAVAGQARTLIHTSNLYFTQPQVQLARRLVGLSFPSRVFLCNSGAEANEAAIKIARKWGISNRDGAFEIITSEGSFHGRTLATVTAGGQHKYSDPFKPLPDGFLHVPYNDLDAIKAATTPRTVAVMLEPVMGEIGIVPAATGYLEGVRKWCDAQGLLLILDEVQTGLGRTGKWFAHQHHGITPDVMTLAKGLGGGVPIGACLASPRADVFEPGDHGTTFGGNPLACMAALSVLSVIERDGLVGHAAEIGDLLHAALLELEVKDVRGIGLMQAFEFAEPRAKAFQQSCLEAGLIVNAVDDNSVRLVPPLIITAAEVERAQSTMLQFLK